MKKIILTIFILVLSFVFVACSSSKSYEFDVKTVVDEIQKTANVDTPQEIKDKVLLSDVMNLTADNIEEFHAIQASLGTKSDLIVFIKSTKGTASDVEKELTAFRDNRADVFAPYDTNEQIKSENGIVVKKGDYVLLVIAGDNDKIANGEVATIYSDIQTTIDTVLGE